MDACDILVVGAGPAGALCAWRLATARPDAGIVLLDAEERPRHRPCGEYLSPGGLGVLDRAGLLGAVAATGAQRLEAVTLRGPHGGRPVPFAPILGLKPPVGYGLGVRRERFDRCLQDAAAGRCRLLRATRAMRLDRASDGWLVRTSTGREIRARLVIGADGRGSIVRRACGLDRRPERQRFALVARATGIAHGACVEMHLGPLGQIGLCPLGDGEVNLNLLLAPGSGGLLGRMPRERLLRIAIAATPSLAGRSRHAVLGPVLATGSLPQGCTAVARDGIALVGDAAGFCDPFTGEGMSLALRGAELLTTAIVDGRGLAGYAADFRRVIGRRRTIGEALQGLLGRRRLSESLASGIAAVPQLSRLLVADAAGYERS